MYPEEIIIFYLLLIKIVLTTSGFLAEAMAGIMEDSVSGYNSSVMRPPRSFSLSEEQGVGPLHVSFQDPLDCVSVWFLKR